MNLALGLIETKGLVGAIEAADAMAKAADVKIVGKEKVSAALMVIKILGEVAAVKAAVDAGSVAAQRVGQLVSAHVIPRPDDQVDILISSEGKKHKRKKDIVLKNELSKDNIKVKEKVELKSAISKQEPEKPVAKKAPKPKKNISTEKKESKNITKTVGKSSGKIPPMKDLEILNVHSLRKMARSFDNFPIKGRDISKANRAKLLDYFKTMS